MRYTINEAVENGIALLNKTQRGKWWKRIDVEKLALHECDRCVLGQLYAHRRTRLYASDGYTAGIQQLGLSDNAVSMGFTTDGLLSFTPLTRRWRKRIRELQATDAN